MAGKLRSAWPHRLAVITAAATLPLIFVGGVVTNTGSALAVPDWPTTFGYNMFTYPWSQMVGGILYEHSHRLIGSTVGLLTVACALSLWAADSRRWVRWLGLIAVAAVVVQGVLGGLRVVLLQHGLAIVHGCLAHAFFALMLGLAVVTSPIWHTAPHRAALRDATQLRGLALLTAALVYTQLVLGAWLTHTGSWLAAHMLGAGLVTLATGVLAARVAARHAERAELRRPALLLAVLLSVQLSLGLGVYLWRFTSASEAMTLPMGLAVVTTHRLAGAAVWGVVVVLALRILRLAAVARARTAPAAGNQRALPVGLDANPGREVLA